MAADAEARRLLRLEKRKARREERVKDKAVSASGAPPAATAFPPSLTAYHRALIHEAAEAAGLKHESVGEGEERRIVLGGVDAGDGAPEEAPPDVADRLAVYLADRFGLVIELEDAGDKRRQRARNARNKKPTAPLTPASFVEITRPLIDMELAAEQEQSEEAIGDSTPDEAMAAGRALLGLRCTDVTGGLLGKSVLKLENAKGGGGGPLPAHKMTPHDIVALRPNKGASEGAPLGTGVVYRVTETYVKVAMDEPPEGGLDGTLRLEKLANEVTYQRLRLALDKLETAEGSNNALVQVLFGAAEPRFAARAPAWKPFNTGLDESQREAVSHALSATDVALIHGPPGTGKTTSVVEVILQELRRGTRMLVCSASNIAVDNLVERVVASDRKARLVRVGHPARLLPSVLDASLEAQVLRSDNSALAGDVAKERKDLGCRLLKLGPRERKEAREIKGELRRLAKEERQRQQAAVEEVLGRSQVMCTTLAGALSKQLMKEQFDLVIIDEAAQALEAACWGALLKGKRCVLAGDHLQLPPTVMSEEANKAGLGRTLFERVHDLYGEGVARMLTVQYRMNSRIMQWASDELYGGKLMAHPSVADHVLPPAGAADGEAHPALLLVDTAGCDMPEQGDENDSKWNDGEASVVMALVRRLLREGVRATDIGVITPYRGQVSRLRELRAADDAPAGSADVEISTVDGFQGREKEAIVISMVRSNDDGVVGFLADNRRMNVAVTRARRHCAVVCDTETVSRDPFLKRMVAYFEEHADYTSAAEVIG